MTKKKHVNDLFPLISNITLLKKNKQVIKSLISTSSHQLKFFQCDNRVVMGFLNYLVSGQPLLVSFNTCFGKIHGLYKSTELTHNCSVNYISLPICLTHHKHSHKHSHKEFSM